MLTKIQFIVLTCDAYLESRVETIRNSWGIGENVVYLSDTYSDKPDVLGYNTPLDYSGIFQKYVNFFKKYDFDVSDYYFFADDDTFVNKQNLKKLKLPQKEEIFCIGRVLCLNKDGTDRWGNQTGTDVTLIKGDRVELPLYYPSGGSGFIISQSLAKSIQNYLNRCTDIPYCKFSDVSIGFWMRNCGVNLIENSNFWWNTHENLLNNTWETYTNDSEVITFHYVNQELMLKYNKKYNEI